MGDDSVSLSTKIFESSSSDHFSDVHSSTPLVIWLDANIDEINNPDCRNTMSELRQVTTNIETFIDVYQCLNFLMKTPNSKTFMIVSGSLGQIIVPLAHYIPQLIAIYIFCGDKSKHEIWSKQWSKIQGVCTEILPICNLLQQIAQQRHLDSIPISLALTNSEILTVKLNQLNQSFMYTQILKEILFDINYDEKAIKDFIIYCRNQFANNEKTLNMINKFKHEYRKYTPIWWYTYEWFLHSMLNRALRLMEVDIIIKMGFFVRDLHRQIEELHKKQYGKSDQIEPFTVYRGQGVSKLEFNKLIKIKGGLISFNNFLSSSKKRSLALLYAHRILGNSDSIGIVFKMIIDPSICSTPFALINDYSFFKQSEQEILFSMHTIFRIGEINQLEVDNNRLWEVELTLTSDNDEQLSELTQRILTEIRGTKGWYSLGQLLLKLGHFNKAEELYNVLLKRTPNNYKKGYIYHQLGWIKYQLGNYPEAIVFYEKSLAIGEKTLPSSHSSLSIVYDNMGLVYNQIGEHMKALSSHEKALAIIQAESIPNYPDHATVLNNIGIVHYNLHEYSKALASYQEAFDIYKKTLPSNHHSLAASYSNIGLVYNKMNDYTKALWYYEKTLKIYRSTLPLDHPDLAVCHRNIGKALEQMCEYQKALSSFKQALDIFQKTLLSTHPHLTACYSEIASVYNNMNDYSTALTFYEKALEISQKTLVSNHPLLASIYKDIGTVYYNMNEYSKALSYVESAINIGQQTLPADHLDLQTYQNTLKLINKTI